MRLLRSALGRARLSLADAIGLMEYHVRRNRIARASHEKTWRMKHKEVEFLLL